MVTVSQPIPKTNGGAPRSVSVLGSTGSVGCNTVELLLHRRNDFYIEAMTANRNVELLIRQARELKPRLAVVGDADRYQELKDGLSGSGIEAAAGREAVIAAAARKTDWIMAAIVGAAGLAPTLEAVKRGAIVALANKECLVSAGDLMVNEVARCDATLVPVDSEHSAIYQVFDFDEAENVERIILTASGGPFRTMSAAAMASVTPEQAVAHPNWSMGAKISVDSATMMNKGLEMIEAYHLFPIEEDQIDVLVHPQSVIHSLVEYSDGSVLAQLGAPDMRTPIAFALSWPKRMAAPSRRLELEKIGTLTFEAPDPEKFPALGLARHALKSGGSAPTILNAANEVAVQSFLDRRIGFLDIARVVEQTMTAAEARSLNCLDDVQDCDGEARRIAGDFVTACPQRP